MTTETTRTPGAFGEVLGELMRARGLEPDPAGVRGLAERSGLDPDGLLRNMVTEDAEDLGRLDQLADELALSHEEKGVLGVAYTFGKGTAEDARAAAGNHAEEGA